MSWGVRTTSYKSTPVRQRKLLHMKKITIAFLVLWMFTCHLLGQPLTTWYQHNVSPGTTSYIVQGYRAVYETVYKKGKWCKGAPLNIFEYPEGLQFDYQVFFNSKGLITSKIYYVDGKATEDIAKYTYNSRNQLLKVVQYERGDVHALSNEYTYDAKGRMIYHMSGYDIKFGNDVTFHNGWRQIEHTSFDKINVYGQVTSFMKETDFPQNNYKYTNEYSDAGLLVKHTWEKDIYSETAKGKVWQRTMSAGQPQSKNKLWKMTAPEKEQPVLRYAYTYKKVYTLEYTEYSEMGDWTKATVFLDDVPFMFLEREITYSADDKKPVESHSINDLHKCTPPKKRI